MAARVRMWYIALAAVLFINGFALSNLSELLTDFLLAHVLRSSDSPSLTVPHFKLKTVGDSYFCSVRPRMWSSPPHCLDAGTFACTDIAPGMASALLRCCSLASHCGGLSFDLTTHPATSVVLGSKLKACQ